MTGVQLKTLLITGLSALALAGCGGGGGDSIASPGEAGFSGGGGGAGGGSGGGGTGAGAAADCPAGFSNLGTVKGGTLRACQLPQTILGNLLVPARQGTVYAISGRTDIGQDRGADPANPLPNTQSGVLTIEPGVRIFGSAGLDYLNVQRGSQLIAEGTPTNPIIFTSRSDIEGTAGVDTIGQWGGIVLSGRAPINACPAGATPPSVNCVATFEGGVSLYGGNTPGDSSGRLRYVQVKDPGFEVQPNRELNGITFNGVGSGTVVDHVQVHNSSDDGMEMFGGTVNLRHIVLTGIDDDSLDTDNGYRGAIQFLIIQQRANGGDRALEMSSAGSPAMHTAPKIANYTLIGTPRVGGGDVQILNTGHAGRFMNGIHVTTRAGGACLDIDDASTFANAPRWDSVVFSCPVPFNADADDEAALFNAGTNNAVNFTSSLSGFVNGANENAVPAFNAASVDPWLQNVGYIGAVRDANDTWWRGWTCGLPGGASC
ncbi:MAG: hypothetical protein WCY15_10060 [Phenylobacterium sp.]|uniref:hypothetical protein n=1 Tax=Phenylobacterium sp. TaxID=1871053 RepID=UPI003561D0A3